MNASSASMQRVTRMTVTASIDRTRIGATSKADRPTTDKSAAITNGHVAAAEGLGRGFGHVDHVHVGCQPRISSGAPSSRSVSPTCTTRSSSWRPMFWFRRCTARTDTHHSAAAGGVRASVRPIMPTARGDQHLDRFGLRLTTACQPASHPCCCCRCRSSDIGCAQHHPVARLHHHRHQIAAQGRIAAQNIDHAHTIAALEDVDGIDRAARAAASRRARPPR
jgi:hypothetical protein